jgi:hypothetical protein
MILWQRPRHQFTMFVPVGPIGRQRLPPESRIMS